MILYYFRFLSTIFLVRCWRVCVCVCVVVFLFTFLRCSADSYIRKHRAKTMTPQAASVSLNMFIILRQERNEIMQNDIEVSREKYTAQYYFEAKISKKNIHRPGNDLD